MEPAAVAVLLVQVLMALEVQAVMVVTVLPQA
jgi:hypothetical protein